MKKANLNLMLGAAGVMLALAALDAGSLIPDATATMKSRLISGAQS